MSSDSGSSYNSINANGTLSDGQGHSGQWTFVLNTGGSAGGQMRISWVRAGYGPWAITSSWFSVASSGYNNYTFHEHDNGVGVTLSPGQSGTFSNTVDASGNSNQSQSAIGSFNNFAFTFALTSTGQQSSTTSATIVDTGEGAGSSSQSTRSDSGVTQVSMAGQNINGMAILSSICVYQLKINYFADDGSDYASGGQSSGHIRSLNKTTMQMSGNSAAGTGQQSSSLWMAEWGASSSNGQSSSWGDPAGSTMSSPPVNLSWPSPSAPPPPSPPPTRGNTGNMLWDTPPQPVSGPPLLEQVEGNLKRRSQLEAMGETPPPLTAGSSPVHGSDGNRTAQQGLAQSLDLSVTMLSQYSGPVLGLGFNAAMFAGSVGNGDASGVVQFGGQLAMNTIEIAALLNPCGLAAKGLAAYGATVTGSQLFGPGGFTFQNFLLTGYNLLALFGACFTGDMLLLCEGGKKRADAIREGDQLWSRDEHDPDGPLVLKRVLRRFERTAKIWHLRLPGQVLRTTLEHPFWVENRQKWLPVGELNIGDVVRTDAGDLLAVEGIEDSGQWERVYNWEVEDYHTYFVSASEDAPSIWAHNNDTCVTHWGDTNAGLKNGSWVMVGGKTWRNYLLSFKWQPGLGNIFTPFKDGRTFEVPAADIRWPRGWGIDGWWKGLFGQRRYYGPNLPPSV